jgi:hypothetical protein
MMMSDRFADRTDRLVETPIRSAEPREQDMFATHIGMTRDLHTARMRSHHAPTRWRPTRNRRGDH